MIIYVYSKQDRAYVYSDTGHPMHTTQDVLNDFDFTLTPPPDHDHTWRWIDDKWIADQPS